MIVNKTMQEIVIITDDLVFAKYFETPSVKNIQGVIVVIYDSYAPANKEYNGITPSLVLIDGGMSGMSSIEAAKYIRTHNGSLTTIWLFTSIYNDEYIYKAYEIGVNRIITKPFDPYMISKDIISLLEKKTQL